METFISVKKIKAEPCKAWKDFKGHKEGDDGYRIYYPDNYGSWCPKDVFEKQYFKLDNGKEIVESDVNRYINAGLRIKPETFETMPYFTKLGMKAHMYNFLDDILFLADNGFKEGETNGK